MLSLSSEQILELDRQFVWHPYASTTKAQPLYPVASAEGCKIQLSDGRTLIDGMASWWCVIHGYNHPTLNEAVTQQVQKMAHVMFGGFTHEPAVMLSKTLVDLTPAPLQKVFLCDSGSVSVEVALKMALQYWMAKGKPAKSRFFSLKNGYHGDTLGAMSVCDPDTGMHHLFKGVLPQHIFLPQPQKAFDTQEAQNLRSAFEQHHHEVAAFILEPIVQGAGGMHFYSTDYLKAVRALCDEFNVLLIADEIATGFGRTGKLFACDHALVSPDIMCLGKSLTGGYMTLAATLCTQDIADSISNVDPGLFMHGPTFMANPLACAVANASIALLMKNNWSQNVSDIHGVLNDGLAPIEGLKGVKSVRSMGAIGVIEMTDPVNMNTIVPKFVAQGIWIRPFGKLVYTMPPFIISEDELSRITQGLHTVIKGLAE